MEKKNHLNLQEISRSVQCLSHLLADTYALYLKTQNYHWNVVGDNFYSLHLFFENHYHELAEAIDVIAERIRALGRPAPGTFSTLQRLSQIKDSTHNLTAKEMIQDLLYNHETLVDVLRERIEELKNGHDEGTCDLLIERLRVHEKMAWMLKSHLASKIPEDKKR